MERPGIEEFSFGLNGMIEMEEVDFGLTGMTWN
jgi:hypothetical protein